ncbi:toll/interleukin-1 receptor domain-containing protein [Hymenobacter metallicola]|uniref:Toll/interleukin-1 receptor domain-containing protein n=1 Tax=Hymenobacter metallicola TaxID=2563114 RepID=A0A4Z0PU83_9BACT|nr:toll/interleukin-1 receptor domain-containing protein [Hymenobacter metallicola]TGE20846.1 toll/interleukin-1 receptor domain-containing protein [Hymenobacter metallicola]
MRKWLRHEQELVVSLKPLLSPVETPALSDFTQENMVIAQKINKLLVVLERAEQLENTTATSSEFKAWWELTTRTLEQLYGADSRPVQHFAGLHFLPVTAGRMVKGSSAYQEEKPKVFKKSLSTAVMVFTDYLRELQDELGSTPSSIIHRSTTRPLHTMLKRLFVSHATKDRALVEEFVELLEMMGLTKDHIFCSSMPGYGIPLGENFLERLKQELSGEVMVLFLLTPNFFDSKICLCEMGATWVLSQSHVPVVVPPLEYKDIQGVIPLTQGFKVNDKLKLNELAIQVAERFGIASGPRHDDQWERKRDKVLARIHALIQA